MVKVDNDADDDAGSVVEKSSLSTRRSKSRICSGEHWSISAVMGLDASVTDCIVLLLVFFFCCL